MKSWDQDDPHELLGTHAFLPGATAQLPLAPLTSEAQAPNDLQRSRTLHT